MSYIDLELRNLEKEGLCRTDVGDGAYVVHQLRTDSISAHIAVGDTDIILVCNDTDVEAMMVQHNPMIDMHAVPLNISPMEFISFLRDMLYIFHANGIICKSPEEVRSFVSRMDNLLNTFVLNRPIEITFYDENKDRSVTVEAYVTNETACAYTVYQDPDEVTFVADFATISDMIMHFLYPEEEISSDLQAYIQKKIAQSEEVKRTNKNYMKAIGADYACVVNDKSIDTTAKEELQTDIIMEMSEEETKAKKKRGKKGKKGEK